MYRDFPYASWPHMCVASATISIAYQNDPFVVIVVKQRKNLYRYMIIIQSPRFTFWFTLGTV